MPKIPSRPIRLSGWAFPFPLLRLRPAVLVAYAVGWIGLFFALGLIGDQSLAQSAIAESAVEGASSGHAHSDSHRGDDGWEGSAEAMAYSEFNHHVVGLFLVVIGCAELSQALRSSSPLWARLLLPIALGLMGIFLLIWSDHEAWPIGSLSLRETLFGGDYEILQHKVYGVVAFITASIEILRRTGRVSHAGWMVPLPAFAIFGGWMLFVHSHGSHPSARAIALHHAVMGTLAITAGTSRLISAWQAGASIQARSRWELLWAALLILLGLQLLLYSE